MFFEELVHFIQVFKFTKSRADCRIPLVAHWCFRLCSDNFSFIPDIGHFCFSLSFSWSVLLKAYQFCWLSKEWSLYFTDFLFLNFSFLFWNFIYFYYYIVVNCVNFLQFIYPFSTGWAFVSFGLFVPRKVLL